MNRSRWSGASLLAAQSAAPFGTLLCERKGYNISRGADGPLSAQCSDVTCGIAARRTYSVLVARRPKEGRVRVKGKKGKGKGKGGKEAHQAKRAQVSGRAGLGPRRASLLDAGTARIVFWRRDEW
eukprot:837531-Prymnesium_polylepis.1